MRIRVLLLFSVVLGLYRPALADVIYTYTGNDFTLAGSPFTTSESIKGSFVVGSALAANLTDQVLTTKSYSFSDGVDTINDLNGPYPTIVISTDSAGNIKGWFIDLVSSSPNEITTADYYGTLLDRAEHYNGNNGTDDANNSNAPGTWTRSIVPSPSAAAPEPSSLLLLGTGLAGGAGMVRRRWLS